MNGNSETVRRAHAPNSTMIEPGTFDPAGWLVKYTALGGVYVANGKLNLCILVNKQSEEELSQIRQMVVDLSEDDKAVILAHLKAIEAGHPINWQAVVAKYEADRDALTNHPYSRMLKGDQGHDEAEQQADALAAISAKSLAALIEAPSPDLAAMRQKLEIISVEYSYEMAEVITPLISDLDRLTQHGDDHEIVGAWERRTAAYTRYNSLPLDMLDIPSELTPEEAAVWAVIDEAEALILAATARTLRGVAIQLWTSLRYCVTSAIHEEAVHRNDLAALEADADNLDGQGNWLIAALRSLKAMGA